MFTKVDFWESISYHNKIEKGLQFVLFLEVTEGLYWMPSARDIFRHMWE